MFLNEICLKLHCLFKLHTDHVVFLLLNFPLKKMPTLNLKMCLQTLVTQKQSCLIIAVQGINMHLFYKD